jgi:hypothetical protein
MFGTVGIVVLAAEQVEREESSHQRRKNTGRNYCLG